jgi:hypothetical protein
MANHHQHYGTPIYDDPEEAADNLHNQCEAADLAWPRYAGRTNNVLRRVGHEWGLHPASPFCWVECDNEETAVVVEALLQKHLNYVGGQEHWRKNPQNDPSCFVYAFSYRDIGYFRTGWLKTRKIADSERWEQ